MELDAIFERNITFYSSKTKVLHFFFSSDLNLTFLDKSKARMVFLLQIFFFQLFFVGGYEHM